MCFCCFDICLFIADLFLQSVIKKKYGQDATNVGDEGDIALISRLVHGILLICFLFIVQFGCHIFYNFVTLTFQENKEGLELLKTAIAKAGYTGKVSIGMDVYTGYTVLECYGYMFCW